MFVGPWSFEQNFLRNGTSTPHLMTYFHQKHNGRAAQRHVIRLYSKPESVISRGMETSENTVVTKVP